MSNFQIEKLLVIPPVLAANTLYLIQATQPDKFNILVSDNSGSSVKSIDIGSPDILDQQDIIQRITDLSKTLAMSDKKTVLRYETDGAKELIIDPAQGFLPNTTFYIANRSVTGNLTIVPSAGMTVNPPKSGSLVLEPADKVSLQVIDSTTIDCYGLTAGTSAGVWHEEWWGKIYQSNASLYTDASGVYSDYYVKVYRKNVKRNINGLLLAHNVNYNGDAPVLQEYLTDPNSSPSSLYLSNELSGEWNLQISSSGTLRILGDNNTAIEYSADTDFGNGYVSATWRQIILP